MSTASKEDGTALDNSPTTPARPTDKQMNLLAIIMQNVISKPDINVSLISAAFHTHYPHSQSMSLPQMLLKV